MSIAEARQSRVANRAEAFCHSIPTKRHCVRFFPTAPFTLKSEQFVGKFFLFSAVLKQGGAFGVLAVVAAINSVISLYYYAKIVKTMFLDTPNPEDKSVCVATNNFTLLIPLTVLTIVFGVYFSPLVRYTTQSLRFFVK